MKSFEKIIYEARRKRPTQKGDSLFDAASDAGAEDLPNQRDSAARRKSTDRRLEAVKRKNILAAEKIKDRKKATASKPAQGGKSVRTAVSGIGKVLQRNKEKVQKRTDLGGETSRKVGRAATGAFQSVFDYKPDKERTDTQQGGMGTALRNMTNVGKAALSGAIKAPAQRIEGPKKTVGGRILQNLKGRFQDRIGVEKTPRSDVGNKITTGLGDAILDNRRKKEYYDKLGQDAREARQKMIRDKFNKMRDEAKVKADASAARNPVRSQSNQQSGKTKEQMRKSIINRQMKSFMKRNPLPKDTLKPNLAQTLLNNARNIVKRNKQMRNSPDYKAQKPKRNINKKFTTESMGRIEAERVARENNPVGGGGRMRTYKEIQNDKAKQDLIKKKRPTSVISQNNESYSHWREEFIWETDKKYPDKIKEIKPMSGKNTITINPEDETSKYKRGY
tara:strand:- start:3 stop:1346 length:1344 start_codon:yes stop_codon:yes gene_type:complete